MEKIRLPDGRIAYPITLNALQVHAKLVPCQYHLKDQGEELVKINLAGAGEEAQPIFSSTSLPAELRQMPLAS